MPLVALNWAEEVQDYIAENSGLGLVVPGVGPVGNLTLGNLLNVDNLDALLGSEIRCTIFEEGGNLNRTGRRHQQERSLRFVFKGEHGQEAVNSCLALLQFLENGRTFLTSTFRTWVARTDKMPTVIAADQAGTHLADFVMTFLVYNRTG